MMQHEELDIRIMQELAEHMDLLLKIKEYKEDVAEGLRYAWYGLYKFPKIVDGLNIEVSIVIPYEELSLGYRIIINEDNFTIEQIKEEVTNGSVYDEDGLVDTKVYKIEDKELYLNSRNDNYYCGVDIEKHIAGFGMMVIDDWSKVSVVNSSKDVDIYDSRNKQIDFDGRPFVPEEDALIASPEIEDDPF